VPSRPSTSAVTIAASDDLAVRGWASSAAGSRLGHVPALDGLRGLAIAAVTGFHFFGLRGGFFGVDLFFVLSGFLITTLLLEELDATGHVSLRSFYVRRARRLLPALGGFLLMMAFLGSVSYSPGQLAAMLASGAFYCLNVVGVLGHPRFLEGPFGHLWSLAEEEQFYLVWPVLLVAALRRMQESRLALGLASLFLVLVAYRAALAANGASWMRLYFAPDTHAEGLVLGCLAAMLRRRGARIRGAFGWPALIALAAGAAVGTETLAWTVYGLPLVEIGCAVLLMAALEPGPLRLLLSRRPLVWLGLLSYSLYLWQSNAHTWVPWLFTAVAAPASYYLVERPFRRQRRAEEQVVSSSSAAMST
jgi:peptidoglycan/LPS O-acetylase OafA/YrhL